MILISAVREQWNSIAWRDNYLELPLLQSVGQRWWNTAVSQWGYDVRNRLVADVFYRLWARIHLVHQRQRNTGRDSVALGVGTSAGIRY